MKKQLTKPGIITLSKKFTPETTKQFQKDMDQALKTVELIQVMKVLIKYDIIKDPDVRDFLNAFTEMLKGWQQPMQGTQVVGEATTRESKCIACEIGKNMTVYEFQYQHKEAKEPYNRIIYGYDFGMLFDIRDGILHDLRICNAFLSTSEMKNVN